MLENKDTFFKTKKSINCRGRLLDLSTPMVMGILNLTPDSFYDGGAFINDQSALEHTATMLNEGASVIDIGAQSTKPRSVQLSAEEEWKRLEKILPVLTSTFPDAIFSIDTFYSQVAERAVHAGVAMVNDISGGSMDSLMFDTIAKLQVPYILMHMQGTPQTMQENPVYSNVAMEVLDYFIQKIELLRNKGVHDIILDPGFGFGKTTEHNYRLLQQLDLFGILEIPVLAGLSRKSMICKVLHIKPDAALTGTITLNTISLMHGAGILRVHDVKEAREAILLFNQMKQTHKESE